MRIDPYARKLAEKAKPDSEARLLELRRQAEMRGKVEAIGIRPSGAPFPRATPESGYYGLPLLKEPQWNPAIPLYFFVGGASGASGVIGSIAGWLGNDPKLGRDARFLAVGGAMLSSALLIYDLGRPSRFLNMLRVFKVQSPMSVGAWTLAAFGTASGAAAFADLVEAKFGSFLPVSIIGGLGRFFSAALGLPLSTYTGVLIGATAIPVWNKNVRTLPIHFGVSGLQSAVSLLELAGHDRSRALNLLGIIAALTESVEGLLIETETDRAAEPLKHGPSGWLTRTGGVLSGPVPLALRLFGGRRMRRWAAWSGVLGSLATRYAWMRAGHASARDGRIPLDIPEELSKELQQVPPLLGDRELRAAS